MFLNGTLSENVYTKQAPGLEKIDSSGGRPYVWKMRKSLYSLQQSPSVWNLTIDRDLRRKDFTPTAPDPCVCTKGSGNSYVMLTLFVDDILLTGPSEQVFQGVRRDLQQSSAMTDMGEATQILGIDIKKYLANGTITLSQKRYTRERTKKTFSTPTYHLFFRPSRGGRGIGRPPLPLRHIIFYAKNPYSKSYVIEGQRPCSDRY